LQKTPSPPRAHSMPPPSSQPHRSPEWRCKSRMA